MEEFTPSIKVWFCLDADEVDLGYVTKKLGIIPTETRTRESFPPQSIAAGFAKDVWSFIIKEENCIAVSILFEKLLSVFKGKEGIIKKLCDDLGLEAAFEVVIHMQDGNSPEVVLPREVIAFAAAINAEIGFDLYCYEL